MANGTLKDEATYFNDTEKYVGDSGSETNMWVVEDSYDFISLMSLANSATYARLINDIDINEHNIYKRGFVNKSAFNNKLTRLYGDGHKIKNIVCMDCSDEVFFFYYIENCDFVNLVNIDSVFPIAVATNGSGSSANTVNGCNFGIYLNNSEFNPFGIFQDCTLNIKGKLRDECSVVDFTNKGYFNQSHVNVDIQVNVDTLFKLSSSSGQTTRFVNSYLTGKVVNKYDGEVKWSSKSGSNNYQYFEPTNSYFAFEYEQITPQEFVITSTHSCFVDGDLFSKNGRTAIFRAFNTNYSGAILTTEQAQDADYLNSIGFACIPVE